MGSQLPYFSQGERSLGMGPCSVLRGRLWAHMVAFPGTCVCRGVSGILCFMPVVGFRDGISQVWGGSTGFHLQHFQKTSKKDFLFVSHSIMPLKT